MKRILIICLLLLVVVGGAAPFLPFDFLKPRIERALAANLGRRVELDAVYLTLFSGPGFIFEGVTIHEDPRAGREPFAYAESIDARVDLLGLLRGRRGFSQLRFDGATFNLVKNGDQPWNVQMLLGSGLSRARMPGIRMRAGRVNVKINQTKSALFFDDADLDLSKSGANIAVRFSAVPSRTDRPGQTFGHFFIRGTYFTKDGAPALDLSAEMEPSSLDSIARLVGNIGFPWQGSLAGDARITGPLEGAVVTGMARVSDGRRASLVEFPYKARMNLSGRALSITTGNQSNIQVLMAASNLFAKPDLSLSCTFQGAKFADLTGGLRQVGVPVPGKLSVQGDLSGTISYSSGGIAGELLLTKGTLPPAEGQNINLSSVRAVLAPHKIAVQPFNVASEDKVVSRMEGTYEWRDAGSEASARRDQRLDLRISAQALPASTLGPLGITSAPVPEGLLSGTIRGTLRLRDGVWAAEYDLHSAEIAVDGLSDPLRVASATVRAKGTRMQVSRVKGGVGTLSFDGEYLIDGDKEKAAQLDLTIAEGSLGELERLFRPTLSRNGGFLQRTLGLGTATAAPDWVSTRKLEGTLTLNTIDIAGHKLRLDRARWIWNGPSVAISGISATIDGTRWNGELRGDLSAGIPAFSLQGSVEGLSYMGGRVDLLGEAKLSGFETSSPSSLSGQGTLRARAISIAPDSAFATATGTFTVESTNGAPRWRLEGLQLARGRETLTGSGTIQADGKVTLDLVSEGKPIRVTGSPSAPIVKE